MSEFYRRWKTEDFTSKCLSVLDDGRTTEWMEKNIQRSVLHDFLRVVDLPNLPGLRTSQLGVHRSRGSTGHASLLRLSTRCAVRHPGRARCAARRTPWATDLFGPRKSSAAGQGSLGRARKLELLPCQAKKQRFLEATSKGSKGSKGSTLHTGEPSPRPQQFGRQIPLRSLSPSTRSFSLPRAPALFAPSPASVSAPARVPATTFGRRPGAAPLLLTPRGHA